jgi:hypothetical protein
VYTCTYSPRLQVATTFRGVIRHRDTPCRRGRNAAVALPITGLPPTCGCVHSSETKRGYWVVLLVSPAPLVVLPVRGHVPRDLCSCCRTHITVLDVPSCYSFPRRGQPVFPRAGGGSGRGNTRVIPLRCQPLRMSRDPLRRFFHSTAIR